MTQAFLPRLLKHRWLEARDARRALGDAAGRLTERVAASERAHTGEIRICIEAGLPLSHLWHDLPVRERAVSLFGQLRVWDTEHSNGVLIYLLLAERAIEIVADRGLTPHMSNAQWSAVIGQMRPYLQAGDFEAALNAAIDAVDEPLRQAFAAAPGRPNPNELPDAPVWR